MRYATVRPYSSITALESKRDDDSWAIDAVIHDFRIEDILYVYLNAMECQEDFRQENIRARIETNNVSLRDIEHAVFSMKTKIPLSELRQTLLLIAYAMIEECEGERTC